MTTIFTQNPIKVNIVSAKGNIEEVIVFIGLVPDNIKKSLKNPKKNGTILAKFYGKNWQKKLGIAGATGGGIFDFGNTTKDKSSSQALNNSNIPTGALLTDDISTDTPDISTDTPDISTDTPDISTVPPDISTDTPDISTDTPDTKFQADKLSDGFSLDEIDNIQKEEEPATYKPPKTYGKTQYVFDIHIYPFDTVLEIKKKLYAVTGIPIFKQHLWSRINGMHVPMSYNIKGASTIHVDIYDIINPKKGVYTIGNIPIFRSCYQLKDLIKIVCKDTFETAEQYYYEGAKEYNLISIDSFVDKNVVLGEIKDKYKLDMIYYSFTILYWPMMSMEVFIDYIKNERQIPTMYPLLWESRKALMLLLEKEKKITQTMLSLKLPENKHKYSQITSRVVDNISYSVINVFQFKALAKVNISLRNLFDLMPLSETLINALYLDIYETKKIAIHKTYKQSPQIKKSIPIGSLAYTILLGDRKLLLLFYKNGNYSIRANWGESHYYGFNKIYSVIEPIINKIIKTVNSYKTQVLADNVYIKPITKQTIKWGEICMNIFYKKNVSDDEYDGLVSLLHEFSSAGIMAPKISHLGHEFYFRKGMYQHDVARLEKTTTVNNYYDFLSNGLIYKKWMMLFGKTRITKIYRRTDIKIDIINIKDQEFPVFYDYIITLFYLLSLKKLDAGRKNKVSSVRGLKEKDPHLYDFRKLYNSKLQYSRTCQKPVQPNLLNTNEYNSLASEKKDRAVKYKNITTGDDAYYYCPNPTYPYIRFLTNMHPKGYCIPCCKKTPITQDKNNIKRIINDICIATQKYEKKEKTITQKSKYIMSYGKQIEPGRLSRMPENTLEPLFYEIYSSGVSGVDAECASESGYYLYGVEQDYKNAKNVGFLNCLINATEMSIDKIIDTISENVLDHPEKFNILLGGNIRKYFSTSESFSEALYNVFISDALPEYVPWNQIFIHAAYVYLKINTILFKYQNGANLIIPSYISDASEISQETHKNLLVLQRKTNFSPIYYLNTEAFFRFKIINTKLFSNNHSVASIIKNIAIKSQAKNDIQPLVTLNIFAMFEKKSIYKIQELFINRSNKCYYVKFSTRKGSIYMPVRQSAYIKKHYQLTFTPFLRKNSKLPLMNEFLKDYNRWVAITSKNAGMLNTDYDSTKPLESQVQPIYPFITLDKWILLQHDMPTKSGNGTPPYFKKIIKPASKVIGFLCNNLNYYFQDILYSIAAKIKDVPVYNIIYDPETVNMVIIRNEKPKQDFRTINVGVSMYNNNIYQLLLLEFITLFNKQKNLNKRKKIKKELIGALEVNIDSRLENIKKIVGNVDYNTIREIICNHINFREQRKFLLDKIDEVRFGFDNIAVEKMKTMKHDNIVLELKKIAQSFIQYGDIKKIKNIDFPNMYVSCQIIASDYCKKKKLIMTEKKLTELLTVLAKDIKNPIKSKWLFNFIFTGNTLRFFRFIHRKHENIVIISD